MQMKWTYYFKEPVMNILRTIISAVAGVALLAGCAVGSDGVSESAATGVQSATLPYDHWRFDFVYPKNLPAIVTAASVHYLNGDSIFFPRIDPTEPSNRSVGRWSPTIGGIGALFNKGDALPANMRLCWDSVIDKKAYETVIWFGSDTWKQMTTRYIDNTHPNKSFWRNYLVIGFAPGGVVRVWMSNQGDPAVLQSGAKITTVSGDKRKICSSINSRIDFNYTIPDGYDQFIKDFIKDKSYPYGEW